MGGHHRAREPEENKIISLSDGPPLGLGQSPFPIEFIFTEIQGGGSRVRSEGNMGRLVRQRLPPERRRKGAPATYLSQVRREDRAGPHLLSRWSPGPLEGLPTVSGPSFGR